MCLTDTSLYIYICVKHFGMANIKFTTFMLSLLSLAAVVLSSAVADVLGSSRLLVNLLRSV